MEKSPPVVSVIIPCYKQARFLPESLGSVLAQTHPHWECIIVDDGSPDHTAQVAQEWLAWDTRFKYVKKENGGLSSARNAGLKAARGAYIQLLDADDILEKNKLVHQLAVFAEHGEGLDVVVSGYRYFHDADETRQLHIFGPNDLLPEVVINSDDKADLIKLFAGRNPMVVSAPLYRRSVFQRIGTFDEDLGANEDWDFHFRCALEGVVFHHGGYAPDSRTLIRIHAQSMITDRWNMLRNLRKFQQKHRRHPGFALENGLALAGYKNELIFFIKMVTPPVLILLARRIVSLLGR